MDCDRFDITAAFELPALAVRSQEAGCLVSAFSEMVKVAHVYTVTLLLFFLFFSYILITRVYLEKVNVVK